MVSFFEMDAWSKLDMERITGVDRTLIVCDARGEEYSTLHASEDRIWVGVDTLPKHVTNAFISAEDARFYDHFGVDIIRIFGAAWADIKAGAYVQGASTISQQLIKLSHLTNEKEMQRKLEEAVLAYQLERRCSKDEILEMYLNYVYFGGGYYGVEAAARGYFGVPARELTVAQSALLAGVLKAPSRYAPHLDREASVGRRDVILGLMEEYGYLTAQEKAAAEGEECVLKEYPVTGRRGYYVDQALSDACAILDMDMDALLRSGYRIHTAMDSGLQDYAEALWQEDGLFPDGDCEGLEAALVLVDVESGGAAALMGGRQSEHALGFNRAVSIQRQPGSVIKPILVYAPALEMGYTAASMLLDDEMDFQGYMPRNASGSYAGWVTMREAVTRSLNVPAVAVMERVGVGRAKAFASRLGIRFDEKDSRLALALGGFTYGVSPMQVATAYAAFARGGVMENTALVMKITDEAGRVLYERQPQGVRVMDEANAYVLTSMLESVVSQGTGKRLGELNIPLAGKTGTVGDSIGNRDIWIAAYNPRYAGAIWIGYDDGSRFQAQEASGGTYPAELMKKLFSYIYRNSEAPDFTMPRSVRTYRIDSFTLESEHVAVLANALTPQERALTEVFRVGTQPTQVTEYWSIPLPPESVEAECREGAVTVRFTPPSRYMHYRLYREDSVGRSILLTEVTGADGEGEYRDETVKKGNRYSYYVVPTHPELTFNGQQLVGRASPKTEIRAE